MSESRPPVPDIAKRLAEAVAEIAESVLGSRKLPVKPVDAWTAHPGARERRSSWARAIAGAFDDESRTDRDVGLLACAVVGLAYVDGCIEERSDYVLLEVVFEAMRALKARQRCPADLSDMADRVQLRAPQLAERDIRELREIAAWVRGEGTGSTLDRDLALVSKFSRDWIRQELHAAATAVEGNMGMMGNIINNYLRALGTRDEQFAGAGLHLGGATRLDQRNGAARALAQALLQDKLRLPRSASEWGAQMDRVMAPWKKYGVVPDEDVYEKAAQILGLVGTPAVAMPISAPQVTGPEATKQEAPDGAGGAAGPRAPSAAGKGARHSGQDGPVRPAPAAGPASRTTGGSPASRHGEEFAWIEIGGVRSTFPTPRQREVIKVLWEAEGNPMHEDAILRKVDPARADRGDTLRMRDVFRSSKTGKMHRAWGKVIISEGPRTRLYRLSR